jgi:hypothetical protein
MRTPFIVLMFLFCCNYRMAAQENKLDGYGVEANYIAGKVLNHNRKRFPAIPQLTSAIDVNILKQTNGEKVWHHRRNFPLVGLGISYTHYGIDSIYGNCIAIYPVWQFNIIKGEKLEWTWRFGLGIGYITRPFERVPSWDTLNNLTGSHLNNYTLLSTSLRYHVNDKVDVHAGLSLSHISNGEFRYPNLGLNTYGGHVGFRYFPASSKPIRTGEVPDKLNNRWLVQARFGMGLTEHAAADGPLYPVYMPTLLISKRYHSKNKVFAGVDYTYYTAIYSFLRNNEIFPGEERMHSWEASFFVGNEFLIGRFGLVLQLGIPLKRVYLREDEKYNDKLGYNFYIIQNENGIVKELTLHNFIKATRLQAAVIEFGMGAAF